MLTTLFFTKLIYGAWNCLSSSMLFNTALEVTRFSPLEAIFININTMNNNYRLIITQEIFKINNIAYLTSEVLNIVLTIFSDVLHPAGVQEHFLFRTESGQFLHSEAHLTKNTITSPLYSIT